MFSILRIDTNRLQHIVSRTHRKFAENDDNWAQLDALLSQLKRIPRY